MTKQTAPLKLGMVVGGFFCPIPSKTPLGLTQQHPYDMVHIALLPVVITPFLQKLWDVRPDLWLSLVSGRIEPHQDAVMEWEIMGFLWWESYQIDHDKIAITSTSNRKT